MEPRMMNLEKQETNVKGNELISVVATKIVA